MKCKTKKMSEFALPSYPINWGDNRFPGGVDTTNIPFFSALQEKTRRDLTQPCDKHSYTNKEFQKKNDYTKRRQKFNYTSIAD